MLDQTLVEIFYELWNMSTELPEIFFDSNVFDIRLNLEMELESSNETSRTSRSTQIKAQYYPLSRNFVWILHSRFFCEIKIELKCH